MLWGVFQGIMLIAYRSLDRVPWLKAALLGDHPLSRIAGWAVMFHLTCYGWLVFRARSAGQIAGMTRRLLFDFAPSSVNVQALLLPLLLYTTPLLIVHACEAYFDDVTIVRRLPVGVRYSIYAATFYLTMLFGNFGGAEFIYFQF